MKSPALTASVSQWANWAGNQSFSADTTVAYSDRDVRDAVRGAARARRGIRVAGSGHSFTPIVEPRDELLVLAGPRGVISADEDAKSAVVYAHSPLRELGPALWGCGLALRNQGDTDSQTLAGATATGTKGSGAALPNISAAITSMTLVDGTGEVRHLDEAYDPSELRAARISLGLLGIVTRIGIRLDTAYGLRENNSSDPLETVVTGAEEELARYRHFSFCWCPFDTTSDRFALPPTAADHCYVKRLSTVPADQLDLPTGQNVVGTVGTRNGRGYAVYPDWGDQEPSHIELEYMVPQLEWRDAFAAVRTLILDRDDRQDTLVQVRWQAPDDNYLSAQFHRPTVSLALVAEPSDSGTKFLRDVHHVLSEFHPRPHWGKMHFFDHTQIAEAFPALPEFQLVRERFDPHGLFLNPHLQNMFGGL